LGGEGNGNVRSYGLRNGAFDDYMIYFFVIVSALSLGVEISIGAPGCCKIHFVAGVHGFVVEAEAVGWL
jgi:hypothetical protein